MPRSVITGVARAWLVDANRPECVDVRGPSLKIRFDLDIPARNYHYRTRSSRDLISQLFVTKSLSMFESLEFEILFMSQYTHKV